MILALTAIGLLIGRFTSRDKTFTLGEYSLAGGAVCTRCGKPFSRHAFSPNMVVGKLERCPHCGKWAIVPRASADALAAAEALIRADNSAGMAGPEESEEDRLRRQIDDSRYD